MAPRTYTNPAPQTEAARQQLGNFYCELCGKGYARANEFSSHETSYEHNHNKRRKELKSMSMGMQNAMSKKKKKDNTDDGLKPVAANPPPVRTFKKLGGFKTVGLKVDGEADTKTDVVQDVSRATAVTAKAEKTKDKDKDESDADDMEWECYDPLRGTPCGSECRGLCASV